MNKKVHPVALALFFIVNLTLKVTEAWLAIVTIDLLFKLAIDVNWKTILAIYFLINVVLRNGSKVTIETQPTKNKSQLING